MVPRIKVTFRRMVWFRRKKAFNCPKEMIDNIDLSNEFNSINGCAVVYSLKNQEVSLYNSEMCEQVSPYSTFKIISTLVGLHNEAM